MVSRNLLSFRASKEGSYEAEKLGSLEVGESFFDVGVIFYGGWEKREIRKICCRLNLNFKEPEKTEPVFKISYDYIIYLIKIQSGRNFRLSPHFLNPQPVFLTSWKRRCRAGKLRPYLDKKLSVVQVGARFPRPQTMNIEC